MVILSSVFHHQFGQRKETYRVMREDVFLSLRYSFVAFSFCWVSDEMAMKRKVADYYSIVASFIKSSIYQIQREKN